jgi:hypothetical protein
LLFELARLGSVGDHDNRLSGGVRVWLFFKVSSPPNNGPRQPKSDLMTGTKGAKQVGTIAVELGYRDSAEDLASMIFEIVYRRFVLRLGHNKTIGAIAHRLCQLIWIILYNGVRYEERGPAVSEKSKRLRTTRMISDTRKPWLPSRTFRKSGMRNPIFDPVDAGRGFQ